MPQLLLRGRVLTFTAEPGRGDDASGYRYFEDGAVLISDGKIARLGDYADVSKAAPEGAEPSTTARISSFPDSLIRTIIFRRCR